MIPSTDCGPLHHSHLGTLFKVQGPDTLLPDLEIRISGSGASQDFDFMPQQNEQ